MSTRNLRDILSIERTSLITDAAARLRKALEEKHWTDVLPSERKLAELMKISRPTLRAALKILLQEGLLGVTARQKYQILIQKAEQAPHSTGRIVMLSPYTYQELDARIPAALTWIDGLRERLVRANHAFELQCWPSCYSGNPHRALTRLVEQSVADCWLLYRSTPAMQKWFSESQTRHLILGGVPAQQISSTVDVDYDAVCRHAIVQFARAGHRSVALIYLKTGLAGDENSKQTFLKACSEYAPQPIEAHIVEHDGTRTGACRAVDQLLGLKSRPTAILSAYTQQTTSVFTRLMEKGIRMPDDMSLICRDYHPSLEFLSPSLAYYEWSHRNYASKIFHAVQSVLHHPPCHAINVRLMPDFVPGDTLGPSPRA